MLRVRVRVRVRGMGVGGAVLRRCRALSSLRGDGSFLQEKSEYNVTVVGGGNAAHILAGYAGSLDNVHVSILNALPHEKELFERSVKNGLRITHRNGQRDILGKVHMVSSNPEDVIPHSDLVLVAVPAHIHEFYFRLIEPFVRPNLNVGVMTAQGCLDLVARNIFKNKFDYLNFFSFETLPWACRFVEYGSVGEVLGSKEAVDVACHPYNMTAPACKVLTNLLSHGVEQPSPPHKQGSSYPSLSEITALPVGVIKNKLPHFKPASNQLEITLMNINSVWHPCITYGRFHDWDGTTPFPSPPEFYEGVDEFTASVLRDVSVEVLAIKEAFLKHHSHLKLDVVRHVSDWIVDAYGHHIADKTSLLTCFTTNKAYLGLTHPMVSASDGDGVIPDILHRYWVEDLPCGMLATRGIAELAGVETPTMDSVIQWMQKIKGKEYLVEMNNGKTSLAGKDIVETRAPQKYGITCISEIVHEYEHN